MLNFPGWEIGVKTDSTADTSEYDLMLNAEVCVVAAPLILSVAVVATVFSSFVARADLDEAPSVADQLATEIT